MEQEFSLPAVAFDVPRAYKNTLYCTEKLPYTIHYEFPMDNNHSIKEILDNVGLVWGELYMKFENMPGNTANWFSELIRTNGDSDHIWSYSYKAGIQEIYTFEMHRRNPSISVCGFLKSLAGKNSCSLYITLMDPPQNFLFVTNAKLNNDLAEILAIFMVHGVKDYIRFLRPTIYLGNPRHFLPYVVTVWILRAIIFRPVKTIHVPSYMFDDPNASWDLKVKCPKNDPNIQLVKESIKTPKGTINITRPATKKEIKEKKKAATLVKQEKLQNKLDRQKLDLEKLKEELEKTQKALSTATESSKVSAKHQKKELEQLNKKIEQLRRSKDSELALKNAEIDEIQRIADEIITSEDSTKQQLQNASWQIQNLNAQVQGLRQQQSDNGLIAIPSEQEKFPGEFEVAIMSAIHFACDNIPSKANCYGQRCKDIWKAFIEANTHTEKVYSQYKKEIVELLSATRKNNFMRNLSTLPHLGMVCTQHTNNHKKIQFSDGDGRYCCTMASTPSENISGPANFADALKNAFFYY